MRVLGVIRFTRRNRFILIVSLAFGFIDIITPVWFDKVINYQGSNTALRSLLEGIELTIKTPFIIAAVFGVLFNLILLNDKSDMDKMILETNKD